MVSCTGPAWTYGDCHPTRRRPRAALPPAAQPPAAARALALAFAALLALALVNPLAGWAQQGGGGGGGGPSGPAPDLIVSMIWIAGDQGIDFEYTITNQGNASSPPTNLSTSHGRTPQPGDGGVASASTGPRPIAAIGPGESHVHRESTERFFNGNWTHRATIDGIDTIAELNETNNHASRVIDWPLAQLHITDFQFRAKKPWFIDEPLYYDVTIGNQGPGDASHVSVVVDSTADPSPTDGGFFTLARNVLAGAETTTTSAWTPSSTGPITVDVKVDPNDVIPETNEDDNTFTLSFDAQIPAPATLDATYLYPIQIADDQQIVSAHFEVISQSWSKYAKIAFYHGTTLIHETDVHSSMYVYDEGADEYAGSYAIQSPPFPRTENDTTPVTAKLTTDPHRAWVSTFTLEETEAPPSHTPPPSTTPPPQPTPTPEPEHTGPATTGPSTPKVPLPVGPVQQDPRPGHPGVPLLLTVELTNPYSEPFDAFVEFQIMEASGPRPLAVPTQVYFQPEETRNVSTTWTPDVTGTFDAIVVVYPTDGNNNPRTGEGVHWSGSGSVRVAEAERQLELDVIDVQWIPTDQPALPPEGVIDVRVTNLGKAPENEITFLVIGSNGETMVLRDPAFQAKPLAPGETRDAFLDLGAFANNRSMQGPFSLTAYSAADTDSNTVDLGLPPAEELGAQAQASGSGLTPTTLGQAIAAAGSLAAVLAAGWSQFTQVGRFARGTAWHGIKRLLGSLPLLGLFSRIQGKKVLDHETRGRIHDHVAQNPGIHYRHLMRELDLPNGTLAHHLRTLEREGLIVRQKDGTKLRFFPQGGRTHVADVLTPRQRAILAAIRSRPGILQSELATTLGVSRQALHQHVAPLRDRGLVMDQAQGRTRSLYLEQSADRRLTLCPGCSTFLDRGTSSFDTTSCPTCQSAV